MSWSGVALPRVFFVVVLVRNRHLNRHRHPSSGQPSRRGFLKNTDIFNVSAHALIVRVFCNPFPLNLLQLVSKSCALRIALGISKFTMVSPGRSTRHDPRNLSSSPRLPSLNQINSQIASLPSMQSSSKVLSLADNSNNNPFNALNFPQDGQPAIDLTTPCKYPADAPNIPPPEDDVTVISLATVSSKPKRKRGAKVLEKKANQPPPKLSKITKVTKAEETEADQPWKKYLKEASEGQAKKGKGSKAKLGAKAGEISSRHFTKSKGKAKEVSTPAKGEGNADEPLELETAIKRRMDWTPPPEDTVVGSKSSQVIDLLSSTAKADNLAVSKASFENLNRDFGRPVDDQIVRPVESANGSHQILRKRKLIETVSINDSTDAAHTERVVPKPKAPKKKPRTITELATAAYVVPDVNEEQQPGPPLESVGGDGEAAKGKGKKRPSRAKKPKKVPPPEPVLLSPTTALRQAANQDYVFGTSSQLAREHSPTFLRDLQSALQASNRPAMEDNAFETPINSDAIDPEPQQKLWNVGARDEDGRVLDLEIIDLAETPGPAASLSEGPNPFGYAAPEKHQLLFPDHFPSEDSFPDIDDLLSKCTTSELPVGQTEAPQPLTEQPALANAPQPAERQENSPSESATLDRNVVDIIDDMKCHPPSHLPSGTGVGMEEAVTSSKSDPEPSKPNFELYTDVQLAREISSYGFKPVKRRTAMLALLDQCWASRQRAALSSLPTNHSISTSSETSAATKQLRAASVVSPKRPRGRPRKNSNTELSSSEPPPSAQPPPPSPKRPRGRPKKTVEPTQTTGAAERKKSKSKSGADTCSIPEMGSAAVSPRGRKPKMQEVIEIPDSASEGSLSPSPYSSPEPTFSPPPVDVSVSAGEDTELSLAASPKSQQSSVLFVSITEAVTTAPPTTDPKQPTFHEMMLMYDPIVLEDLATWLNTGQLSRVGYDGEVSPTEVKQWCESKSVCCLWRESLRGGERKRY
ncbi:Structure-specific endonuclease subunit SLX4 [Colletotrichum truncatum]|uniref:Structure-specific endonuclease subunit SLX4 n=1 Tax=Colletotrichum truncatum TaxID=5467 RepID=A0ACC3YUN4_COLTU